MHRVLPAYHRSLPTELARELVEMDKAGATREELTKKMDGLVALKAGMIDGDTDNGYITLGNGISFIHEIRPAAQIVADLTRDLK